MHRYLPYMMFAKLSHIWTPLSPPCRHLVLIYPVRPQISKQVMGSKLHWPVQPIQPIIQFPVVNLWPNQVQYRIHAAPPTSSSFWLPFRAPFPERTSYLDGPIRQTATRQKSFAKFIQHTSTLIKSCCCDNERDISPTNHLMWEWEFWPCLDYRVAEFLLRGWCCAASSLACGGE